MKCADEKKALAVFEKALAKIKPSPKETERNFEAANHLIKKLEAVVPENVEVALAGSLAKGTDLRGKNEFDIFLLFPRHYPHHEMTMLGLYYARKAFHGMKIESRYAEHPYLQVFHGDYHADIVPAYKIGNIGEKGSSVDRSQLHTAFVNAKLDSEGKSDVRLLKQFMKNFGIYGAETRVEGFSGYLCEILIAHYGSLLGLMEAASSWHEPALDAEGKQDVKLKAKFSSPLIAIDPVDPGRNVAAVVANTSLSRFIFECRRFLANPSEKFFFSEKRKRSLAEIRKAMRGRGTACFAVRFAAPEVVQDVLWPQLKKAAQALKRKLQELDFSVFGLYHWSDGKECVILFEFDRWELPAVRKAVGPSIRFAKDVDAFVKRHSDALNLHIEHDRIVAVEKREETMVRENTFVALCRSPKGLGIPKNMEIVMKDLEAMAAEKLLSEKYREMLSDYFFAKIA
ncbi:MAG: CCA tRNA nucleotidyltransferase [Candidatus Anstonellaceae archaeon]